MQQLSYQYVTKYLKNKCKKRLCNSISYLLLHPQQRISSLSFEIYKWVFNVEIAIYCFSIFERKKIKKTFARNEKTFYVCTPLTKLSFESDKHKKTRS